MLNQHSVSIILNKVIAHATNNLNYTVANATKTVKMLYKFVKFLGGACMTADFIDPRIKRTKELIRSSFLSLIAEKGFDPITVQDITQKAEINRATFYRHYEDKYDLLEKIIDEKLEIFLKCINPKTFHSISYQYSEDEPHPIYLALFEHVLEHVDFYKVMLGSNGLNEFRVRMIKVIMDTFYNEFLEIFHKREVKIPEDLLLNYIISAELGVITYWVESGLKYSPKFMAIQLTKLSIFGPMRSAGFDM